ncbi:MAG TPA: EAL domain-containing protein [Albitalea sp.]|uniref:EAL domain-containing protein n=1 Tax=Piscinibacter sp. TaxID=1903157 RepID=UPI002ED196A6
MTPPRRFGRSATPAALDDALRSAIRHRDLYLEYQPQVTARGEVRGFEALVRWQRERFAAVPPADVVALAHRLSLADALTEFVLDQVCLDILDWRDQGATVPRIAVNLTAMDLARDDLAARVLRRLHHHRIDPARLDLELTETALALGSGAARRQLSLLRAEGVRVAIDDFGTGHSSLAELVVLPLDTLKIDRGFLTDVPGDARREHVLRHVVELADDLELRVVAEGVERPEQLAWLAHHGVARFQGHLFHRAAPAAFWTATLCRERPTLTGWETTELAGCS